jgi:uncharacterized phage protein (TIGR01671 family)
MYRVWNQESQEFQYLVLSKGGHWSHNIEAHSTNALKEWQQYIGRKDKNDRYIYEGDILDDGGVIEFRDDLNWDSGGSVHSGFFSTKGYEYREDGCLSYHYQISEHEVIGHIYENPELLK